MKEILLKLLLNPLIIKRIEKYFSILFIIYLQYWLSSCILLYNGATFCANVLSNKVCIFYSGFSDKLFNPHFSVSA